MITHTTIAAPRPRKKQDFNSRLRENLFLMAILLLISLWAIAMAS